MVEAAVAAVMQSVKAKAGTAMVHEATAETGTVTETDRQETDSEKSISAKR
jgi:hypothetical protein